MNIIDVHNHIGLSLDGGHGTLKELLEIMQEYRIGTSVLFATDEEGWEPTYTQLNDKIINAMESHPGKIIAFARIVPSHGKEAIDEFKRCLERGVKGLKLKGNDGFHPKEAEEIFGLIKGRPHFPVLMHTDHELAANHPKTWETYIQKYPTIDFIMAHGGKSAYKICAEILKKYPNAYCDTSTLSFNRTRWIYEHAGAGKMLFASDYPYSHVGIELPKYRLIVKDKQDLEDILVHNAKKVLGL